MERREIFEEGEFYHIYNRGIDKRRVFFNKGDKERFLKLMFLRNTEKRIDIDKVQKKALHTIERGETLVDICAYALMDNHFHFLVREKQPGGISAFMRKFMTSYVMYMNTKYDRTGSLMCRPFRSKHIHDDDYLRWVQAYIHLNPLDIFQPNWEEEGVSNMSAAEEFLLQYEYSSYKDYVGKGREMAHILNKEILAEYVDDLYNPNELLGILKEYDWESDPRG